MIDKKLLKHFKAKPHKLGHYLGYNLLGDVHSDWIKQIWLDGKDEVLQAHRNSYKTSAVIIVGAIWYLLFRPNDTILILRKTDDKASGILQAIEDHYRSDKMKALYKRLFDIDSFVLSDYNNNKMEHPLKTKVTKEKSIEAGGIGADITGSHFDRVIGDDIVTIKDRVSKAERERTKIVVMELQNIKNVNGKIGIEGTPWHKDDAFSILDDAKKYPVGSIKINGFTQKKLAEIKRRTTSSLYAANYLLRHIADEGRLLKNPVFDVWPEGSPIACLDPAYSGKNTTALVMGFMKNGLIYARGWVWPEDITELYEKIVRILNNYFCGSLYVESNADHELSVKAFRKLYPSVLPIHEKANKHLKIVTYVKGHWPELVLAEDCQEEFINQVLDYEEGQEPDDAPDALADLIRILKKGAGSNEDIMDDIDLNEDYEV